MIQLLEFYSLHLILYPKIVSITSSIIIIIIIIIIILFGDRDGTVVKVLCYKSEGRLFDPSWCQWIFHWNKILPIALWPWGGLILQQKWVPGAFPGGKGGRCVRLTTLPQSCAFVTKSGNLNFLEPSGPLQACNGTALLLPFITITISLHISGVKIGLIWFCHYFPSSVHPSFWLSSWKNKDSHWRFCRDFLYWKLY